MKLKFALACNKIQSPVFYFQYLPLGNTNVGYFSSQALSHPRVIAHSSLHGILVHGSIEWRASLGHKIQICMLKQNILCILLEDIYWVFPTVSLFMTWVKPTNTWDNVYLSEYFSYLTVFVSFLGLFSVKSCKICHSQIHHLGISITLSRWQRRNRHKKSFQMPF